jgi:hypothetical protein
MRRRIVLFLTLLPLVMLTGLSCPVKQSVKLLLGIPAANASLQLERGSSAACAYASIQNDKIDKRETRQHRLDTKSTFGRLLLQPFMPDYAIHDKSAGPDRVLSTSTPLFIFYRHLII